MELKNETPVVDIFERQIQKYIRRKRPPIDIRPRLDISYSYENHCLEILEIRPDWMDENKRNIYSIAKAQFVKSKNCWKVYWKRSSGKWEAYKPNPVLKSLSAFFDLIDDDPLGCFWG